MKFSDKNTKILVIACAIIAVALFHYGTPGRLMYVHILLQALFLLPVTLAGLWFGKRGGLFAVAALLAVYVHHAVTVMMPTKEIAVGNGIQILLLFVVGLLTGTYSDLKRGYWKAIEEKGQVPEVTFSAVQDLLVYLDESGAGMNAVRYVAGMFGRAPDVKVALFQILSNPSAERFGSEKEHEEAQLEVLNSIRTQAQKARELLVQSGFADSNIRNRLVERQNARASDLILEEQKAGNHSAIVVGRRRLSRAEEFLFGSVAIRLSRQASCPVWVIGEDSSREETATKG